MNHDYITMRFHAWAAGAWSTLGGANALAVGEIVHAHGFTAAALLPLVTACAAAVGAVVNVRQYLDNRRRADVLLAAQLDAYRNGRVSPAVERLPGK